MSLTPSSQQSASLTVAPTESNEIDASCRAPLLVLFAGGVVWLLVASALALIASIRFHAPGLFANVAELSYGRVHEAATSAQLYGFALPVAFGVALWIFARLGDHRAIQPGLTALGGVLWHVGVAVGVWSILCGDNTGFHNLEMPRAAAVLLALGFLLIGLWSLLTLNFRREQRLSPPQWFLLTAFFWFPWIYATANLLLLVFPVRGVEQSVIDWWYSNNLTLVWMSLVGLAAAFYFIPSLTGRRLHSEYLALFTFWTLLLFGSWAGIPANAPVPAWMPSLSTVATVAVAVPLLAVWVNVYRTLNGRCGELMRTPSLMFIGFGVAAWLLAGAMQIANTLPDIGAVTNLTWFTVAQSQLNNYGFFALMMFGAVYRIVPRVTGIEWPLPKLVRAHFWFAAVGILMLAVPLAIGGVVQGLHWNNASIPAVDVANATLPFLRVSTLGDTLILIGHVLLAGNLVALSARYCRAHFAPACRSLLAPLKPAEVKP